MSESCNSLLPMTTPPTAQNVAASSSRTAAVAVALVAAALRAPDTGQPLPAALALCYQIAQSGAGN